MALGLRNFPQRVGRTSTCLEQKHLQVCDTRCLLVYICRDSATKTYDACLVDANAQTTYLKKAHESFKNCHYSSGQPLYLSVNKFSLSLITMMDLPQQGLLAYEKQWLHRDVQELSRPKKHRMPLFWHWKTLCLVLFVVLWCSSVNITIVLCQLVTLRNDQMCPGNGLNLRSYTEIWLF